MEEDSARVAHWLIYNGYKKTKAVKLGNKELKREGIPFCRWPYK
jgi:hypothetical protein